MKKKKLPDVYIIDLRNEKTRRKGIQVGKKKSVRKKTLQLELFEDD